LRISRATSCFPRQALVALLQPAFDGFLVRAELIRNGPKAHPFGEKLLRPRFSFAVVPALAGRAAKEPVRPRFVGRNPGRAWQGISGLGAAIRTRSVR